MTSITEVWSASARLFAITWRPLVSYYNTLLCCDDYFSSSSLVLRAFSALCMYSKFGHHPHLIGYLCAKFHFFRDLHWWASPWRKITYSVTHWITYPAYLMPWEPKHLHFGTTKNTSVAMRSKVCNWTVRNSVLHRNETWPTTKELESRKHKNKQKWRWLDACVVTDYGTNYHLSNSETDKVHRESQQQLYQKWPKSVDVCWSYSVHQCRFLDTV